ncbi:ribose 5-phosphate isomerase A-domain-containing protein [Tirmania nivea]|nr:ribose 5-phosphate isomerase A-domain-containing protein [Tirmania nivea]
MAGGIGEGWFAFGLGTRGEALRELGGGENVWEVVPGVGGGVVWRGGGGGHIDPALNCIKGGGACLFQEKLVAIKAEKFVVVAVFRKISSSLSTAYALGVPIEVVPQAVSWVTKRLVELGSVNPTLRMGGRAKAGPCVTDNGNFIIDAPFRDGCVVGKEGEVNGGVKGSGIGDTGNVERLAEEIKRIVGVVEHGIFCRGNAKAVMAYFGMEHGDVTTRTAMKSVRKYLLFPITSSTPQ